ncbi:MAG: pseudouridine synthase [Halioglobus sp.]
MASLILLNKPFQVLSQFTDRDSRRTLADCISAPGFRAAGRLDFDSEGLILLTDDGQLQQRIANPRHKVWKTYLVQVEGCPSDADLDALRGGVDLKDGRTRPAKARLLPHTELEGLWPREPPVRTRLNVPDTWLELSIREGRNRQVRRMTAAIGCPTLRLIRRSVGDWSLGTLQPGESRSVSVHLPGAARERPRKRSH